MEVIVKVFAALKQFACWCCALALFGAGAAFVFFPDWFV